MSNVRMGCAVGDMSLYREGVQSPCTGPLHQLIVQWDVRGNREIQGEKPEAAVVCEGHLPGFRNLGERKGYKFRIISDIVVESPIAGERET